MTDEARYTVTITDEKTGEVRTVIHLSEEAAELFARPDPVIPCPRCGGEGYDNVFLDGDTPRHCGADVSYPPK